MLTGSGKLLILILNSRSNMPTQSFQNVKLIRNTDCHKDNSSQHKNVSNTKTRKLFTS